MGGRKICIYKMHLCMRVGLFTFFISWQISQSYIPKHTKPFFTKVKHKMLNIFLKNLHQGFCVYITFLNSKSHLFIISIITDLVM